jgi:Uma2 family endonuclease
MVAEQDPTRQRMSVEEWRALLRTSEVKYEYHDGWVVAMAGGSLAHGAIAINVIRALQDALGERPCWVHNSDVAVRLSPGEYRFPDATVSCDERDRPWRGSTEVQSPRVVVEVLSDSTEKADRTTKFALYRACPSVEEYVLIATEAPTVEVYRRGQPRWTYQWHGPGEHIEVDSLGIHLSVDQLYRLTDVPLSGASQPPASNGVQPSP